MKKIYEWQFALFSANLHRYLPQLGWEQHFGLYQQWCDQHHSRPLDKLRKGRKVHRDVLKALIRPSLITLFHLGDHAVWPILLAEAKMKFDILLDRAVYQRAQTVLDDLQLRAARFGYTPRYFFSDDAALLLKIRAARRAGHHLLCYGDGSSGATTNGREQRIEIPFMDNVLCLKKGIPFVSYVFDMPIISMMPHYEQTGRCVLRPKYKSEPLANECREAYIERSLTEMYAVVGDLLRHRIWQWECWGYLHENGMVPVIANQYPQQTTALVCVIWQNRIVQFDRQNYALILSGESSISKKG